MRRLQLLTTRDVAEALGMSQRQVRNLATDGRLRSIRIDHHLRFDPADIAQLIQQSANQSVAVPLSIEGPAGTTQFRRASTDPALLTRIEL